MKIEETNIGFCTQHKLTVYSVSSSIAMSKVSMWCARLRANLLGSGQKLMKMVVRLFLFQIHFINGLQNLDFEAMICKKALLADVSVQLSLILYRICDELDAVLCMQVVWKKKCCFLWAREPLRSDDWIVSWWACVYTPCQKWILLFHFTNHGLIFFSSWRLV